MRRFTLGLFAILGIMTVTQAAPHHRDDPYSPVIDFLKQLRKAQKHSGSGVSSASSGIFPGVSSSSSGIFPGASNSGIFGGSGGGRDTENVPAESQTSTPILFPSSGGSQSQSSSSGGNSDRITIQLPSNLQPGNRPPSSPQDIQRINSGVSTILSGVRSFDLGQILRGAFIFPANNNVKSVANNVLDSIFGPAGGQPPAQN